MRVGALPQHPTGVLGYAFNWSPEGVVNEYLNDCEVIEEGVRKWVSSMEWRENIYVHGTQLEAFTTSGGLGTMCETFHGRVENLDYKTMRYPGHMDLMNFFFHELLMRQRRELAGEILTNAKPAVSDDVVYMHVASEGEIDGQLRRLEFVRAYYPRLIGGLQSTAIAWTTASSVVSVIELVRAGILPDSGFLRQEDVPLLAFLATLVGASVRRRCVHRQPRIDSAFWKDELMSLEWEQLIVDAADPVALGRWWATALGWVVFNDDPEEFEIRPAPDRLPGLLFARVAEPKTSKNRLHLDLRPTDRDASVARLLALGATHADIGQGEQSWVVLEDPEGNEFCVLSSRAPG